MKKFALNFICKNESHVIDRMLESVRPITDLIVASDTGSTDETIALIKAFGVRHAIPTYVFERPFDNFGSARNHALDMLLETVDALGWDRSETYGFWLDCDEEMVFEAGFSRDQFVVDIYKVNSIDGNKSFTKKCFFRLNRTFSWVGPIHETLKSEGAVNTAIIPAVHILYYREGASWKGDLEQKYLNYATILKAFVAEGNRERRWLWYLGTSYQIAASYCENELRRATYYREALMAFDEGLATCKLEVHMQYLFLSRAGAMRLAIGEGWPAIKPFFQAAHLADQRMVEPLLAILNYYCGTRQFNAARIYGEFAVEHYHNKVPRGSDLLTVDVDEYLWRTLFAHYLILLETDFSAARQLYPEVQKASTNAGSLISEEESRDILLNAPWVRKLQRGVARISSTFRPAKK